MKISNLTNNYKTCWQTNNVMPHQNYNNQVTFQGFLSNVFSGEDTFIPKKSIIADEWGYVSEVSSYFSKLSKTRRKGKIASETHRLFNLLKSQQEKKIFKNHFGMHLYDDTSQQNQLAAQTQHTKPKKPVTNPVENKSNKINTITKQTSTKKSEILSKDSLLKEFESLENDDIPSFVTKIANGTREEQYNLLEIYKELFKKHDELMENDPSTKFKKEIREKYTEQLKKEIREEFDKSGKKYNSTEVIKETYKRLDKMAQDAGLDNYAPSTLKLGQKLVVLGKQMEEQNISFVPKAPVSFETEEKKWKYINDALWAVPKNEASAMEALEVFEKYGEKRFVDETTSVTSLDDLRTSISGYIDEILSKGILKNIFHNETSLELTNVLLQRYIQVYSKFATNQIDSRAYPDVKSIWRMFDSYKHIANKDTILMMINAMKDFAVDKEEYTRLKYFVKHFSPELYESINYNDLQDIEKAIAELGNKVENLPDSYLQT